MIKNLLFIYLASVIVSSLLMLVGIVAICVRNKILSSKYGVAKSFESDMTPREYSIILLLFVPLLNLVLAGMVLWVSLSDVGGDDI